MITQSGCFTGGTKPEQIDTATEAAAAVEAIESVTGTPEDPDPMACTVVKMAVCCDAMAMRLRLLTWAVVLLVVYVLAKELK